MHTTRDDDVALLSSIVRTAILGAALIAFSLAARGWCAPTRRSAAEVEARGWARGLHVPIDAVTCKDADPSHDGHLICVVSAGGKAHRIECIPAGERGHGCRTPVPTTVPVDAGAAQ